MRGRRSDAMSALAAVSQAQERWRSDNTAYKSSLEDLPGGMAVSQGGHYDLAMVADTVTASAYSVKATAKSTMAVRLTCRGLSSDSATMTMIDGIRKSA